MTSIATSSTAENRAGLSAPSLSFVVILLVALTAVRIVGLYLSTVDLFFDEAQYWAWSRELAWGYFSKPPLLAWIIAAFDPVCGSTEDCVRVASPLLYLGTSLAIYAVANLVYGQRTAAWSAIVFALGPGVIFSTRIISTDVPLLFFWAVALLAYVQLLRAADWRWAVVLGIAIGLGMMAKYAMIYFVLCAVLAACVDRDARALLMRRHFWLALAVGLLMLVPNAYWNFANDFVTLKHTGDNISGGGFSFAPSGALEFIGSQFGVAGPMVFAAFLVLLVKFTRLGRDDKLMLAFAIPPLALVTALSFVRGAHENWAAPSFISMTIVAVAWWVRDGRKHWLRATLILGLFLQALLIAGDTYAYDVTVPALRNKADLYARTLGWRGMGEAAASLARRNGARTVAAEERAEVAALIYYLRNEPVRVASWPTSIYPNHQFDITRALENSTDEPALFISPCSGAARLARFYSNVTPLGRFDVRSGPTSGRHYFAFMLAGRRQDIAPLRGPCEDGAK